MGGVTFIAGGPHATMCYSDVLRNHNIDIAVLGEGEETLCELLLRLENNEPIDATAGIAFKKGGQVVITKSRLPVSNLDDIPFPAWDLIRLSDYSDLAHFPLTSLRAGKRYMALFTSRGCPYQCTYCHQIFGKVFRKRSAENVFKEIEELHTVYGVDEFFVFDDTFNFDRKRAEEISDKIISSGIKIWIAFPNGLRGDILDTALLEKLKAAGTYLITFSVESASPRIQKMIRKNLDIEKLNVMIEAADRLGMVTRGFFMLGFPGETIAEAKETIEFAARSKLCLASFFCVTFQKSTRLFEEIIKEFPEFSVDFNADDYLHPNRFYQEKITKIPLRRLLHWAHVKFYLNPGRIIKIWLRIKKKNPIYYLDYFFSYKSRFGRYQ
jgi:anaerobic magnesium-protoporphyrin IX monomethyl ester cyclase